MGTYFQGDPYLKQICRHKNDMVASCRTVEPALKFYIFLDLKKEEWHLKVDKSCQIQHKQDRATTEHRSINSQIFDRIFGSYVNFCQWNEHQGHNERLHHNWDPSHGRLSLLRTLLYRVENLVDRVGYQNGTNDNACCAQALPHTRQAIVCICGFQSQV